MKFSVKSIQLIFLTFSVKKKNPSTKFIIHVIIDTFMSTLLYNLPKIDPQQSLSIVNLLFVKNEPKIAQLLEKLLIGSFFNLITKLYSLHKSTCYRIKHQVSF